MWQSSRMAPSSRCCTCHCVNEYDRGKWISLLDTRCPAWSSDVRRNLLHRSLQSHNVMRVMYANEQVTGYRSWTRDRVENTENRALTGLSGGYIRYNESWFRLIRVQVERVWGLKEFGCEGLAADGDQLGDWFQRRSHQWWPSNGFRVEFHPIRSVWVSQKQKVV